MHGGWVLTQPPLRLYAATKPVRILAAPHSDAACGTRQGRPDNSVAVRIKKEGHVRLQEIGGQVSNSRGARGGLREPPPIDPA